MPPTTRSKALAASMADPSYQADTESISDTEIDSDASDTDSSSSSILRSPTGLLYRIDDLPAENQTVVCDAFDDPPKISLQRCRRINDTYAFQMTELVTRSVRIRASDDGDTNLSCSCRGHSGHISNEDDQETCPHLLWLLDQLLSQTVYHRDRDRSDPFSMGPGGFAKEMGDPFQVISNHHLEIIAAGLHCSILDDAQSEDQVDSMRALEVRELLSSIYCIPPNEFRPDIFDHPLQGRKILKRNDIDTTLFRMLVDNGHFFQYMLSLSRSTDAINDPFRKLSQRVDLVLDHLDRGSGEASAFEETTSVSWAAYHLTGCVSNIRAALYIRDRPVKAQEALSACATLVHILTAVVTRNQDVHRHGPRVDRNLYLRLIGDRDEGFVIDVLALIPEAASQFLNNLEDLLEQIQTLGARATYVEKFRFLLGRSRNAKIGPSLKRQGPSHPADRRPKKMK